MIRFCTHFAPLSYRYFYDPLIDIDIDISQRLPIDIDIFQNCLIDIDIFQNCLIDIDIFKNDHIDIDIDIFQKCRYIDNRYSISIYRTGLLIAKEKFSLSCICLLKTKELWNRIQDNEMQFFQVSFFPFDDFLQ